tara:strand:+ start:413 stop:757 length:345 start_codon:yes stop_codon:yes gene_type:complete
MKKIWIIPSTILIANILILVLGIVTNSGFVGTLFGGLIAVIIDPVIIISGLLIGIIASDKKLKMFLLVFFVGTILLTALFHFTINTTYIITDLVRFDGILIIASVIFLIKRLFI